MEIIIKTKYNPGDTFFALKGDKIRCFTIKSILLSIYKDKQLKPIYCTDGMGTFYESEMYDTQEALIESIMWKEEETEKETEG